MINSIHVVLKPSKDKPIRNRHHWIFSGAIESMPKVFENGTFLPVYSFEKEFLGIGYFNIQSKIVGRMVSFEKNDPKETIEDNFLKALSFRQQLFKNKDTNGFRLINAEGDGIPGLVVDVYDRVVVIQSSTLGIDLLIPWLTQLIIKHLNPVTIFEKSTQSVRKQEGLPERQGFLYGKECDEITFLENGITYIIHLKKSQKTGFFLDHREMRQKIRSIAAGKKVLNTFSYTGGFTLAALAGGASQADSVDISQEAIEGVKNNFTLNHFDPSSNRFVCADVFKFIREEDLSIYDIIILDPPAFAKKHKDIIPACRGYKDINRVTMQKMKRGSFLLSSSCSHYIDQQLFQTVVFQAAAEAKREVKIVGFHQLAPDHPINLFHPEGDYLKSLLLYVN